MTRQQEMAQQLRDNPSEQWAVDTDVQRDRHGRPVAGGGYIAAIAIRTPTCILSAVIDFPSQKNIGWMLRGILHGLATGEDPLAAARRFIEIENVAMASTMETSDTKGLARNNREVDFDKKLA